MAANSMKEMKRFHFCSGDSAGQSRVKVLTSRRYRLSRVKSSPIAAAGAPRRRSGHNCGDGTLEAIVKNLNRGFSTERTDCE